MDIVVCGLGTLGGFFAKFAADLDEVDKITLIDYDNVEEKNLKNSIYRRIHVNEPKVEAIESLIRESNDKIKIVKYNKKFIEGKTEIPKNHIFVDCRDFTYNRLAIDVRLYISSRRLVVDCRSNVEYDNHYEGKYITELSKIDLASAALSAVSLFRGEPSPIKRLMKNKSVYEHKMDSVGIKVMSHIKKCEETGDIIYDLPDLQNPNEKLLLNFHENAKTIMKMNQHQPIELYVGSKETPMITENIPKGSLQTYQDVLRCLLENLNLPFVHNHYIVCPTQIGQRCMVELVPETGAA